MKKKLSIIIIGLCSVLITHAHTIIYMHEVQKAKMGPENQYTPRHARSAEIVPIVETSDNTYNVTVYNGKECEYEIYFTDVNNTTIYYQNGTIDDSSFRIIVPDIIDKEINTITIKVNNKTYIGHKQ